MVESFVMKLGGRHGEESSWAVRVVVDMADEGGDVGCGVCYGAARDQVYARWIGLEGYGGGGGEDGGASAADPDSRASALAFVDYGDLDLISRRSEGRVGGAGARSGCGS